MDHAEQVIFYREPEFWVAAGFVIFVAFLIWQGVHKALGKGLDNHGAKIAAQIGEAERLRAEAERLLADAEAKLHQAEADAGAILDAARRAAADLTAKAEADLAAVLQRRTADADTRIATAERAAVQSLRARVADLATRAAGHVIANDSGEEVHARLADHGIDEVARRVL